MHHSPNRNQVGTGRTDDAHARSCAGIGESHPALLQQALDQLLHLVDRASHTLERPALVLLERNLSVIGDRLEELASSGNRVSSEILAFSRPQAVDTVRAESRTNYMAPLTSGPGHSSMGTGAIGASILAASLPVDRRFELMKNQLARARSPYEGASNRSEYLLAAANLAEGLSDTQAESLITPALREATEPATIESDEMAQQFAAIHLDQSK